MGTKIHLFPSFHYDVAYCKTFDEYLDESFHAIDEGLRLLENNADFTFGIEQVILIREYWNRFPKKHKLLKIFTKQERLVFAPGMFTMPDSNIPSGENFIQNALIGRKWLKKHLNYAPDCCWMADVFGHNPQSPQLANECGFSSYLFERGMPKDNLESPFYWEGINGSKILSQWEVDSYYGLNLALAWINNRSYEWVKNRIFSEIINPLKDQANNKNLLFTTLGGDFHVPTQEQIDFVRKWNMEKNGIEFIFSTPFDYFSELEKGKESLKSLKLDLNPLCEGCNSSRIRIKQQNRQLEEDALKIEALSLLSNNENCNSDALWEDLTWNAFHDIICGSLIKRAVPEAYDIYIKANKRTQNILSSTIKNIVDDDSTSKQNKVFAVFNPLPYKREEIISFTDSNNKIFKTVKLEPSELKIDTLEKGIKSNLSPNGVIINLALRTIENRYVKIVLGENGTVKELYDKENDQQFVPIENGMNNPKKQPDFGDLWNLETGPFNGSLLGTAPFYDPCPVSGSTIVRKGRLDNKAADADCYDLPEIKIVDNNSLESTFQITFEALKITMFITLRANEKFVRFKTVFMPTWKKYRLRVAFPTLIKSGKIRHSVPFGHIERPDGEYACQRWMDYSDNEKGLLLMNKGIPGNNVTENVMMLSLFRAVSMENAESESWYEEKEEHTFEYALMPFNSKDKEYNPERIASKYCIEPVIEKFNNVKLLDKPSLKGVELNGNNIELSSIRKKGDKIIIRVWETAGKNSSGEILLPFTIKECYKVNAVEENAEEYEFIGNKIELVLKPFQILTLSILLKK